MSPLLPIPPLALRQGVGPFADAQLFARSGADLAGEIVQLCSLPRDARVLEIGCGCGRLARGLADHLTPHGRFQGFDIDRLATAWCDQNLGPRLPNFRFTAVDVRGGSHNASGSIPAERFCFPYADSEFDLAIAASVFTHMLPDGIVRYVSEAHRVLRPEGALFMTVLLFDQTAAIAVRSGTTIFNFIHPVGPCLTFDAEKPEEGIACSENWLTDVLKENGFVIECLLRGNWRTTNSYCVRHDYVLARNAPERL